MAQSIEEKVQHGGRIGEDGRPLGDAQLRDRRRGRQHPHRRGAHAADHLRRARAGRRPLRQVRQARARRCSRARRPRAWTRAPRRTSSPTSTSSSTRSTRRSSVTEQGVAKAERFMGIDHLYRAENGHLVNHLIQSLKAESLYKRDVDYAVVDDEVMIIDEFTGRILEGRRWSEGLHQAIEAKEGVRVQEENQTLATITLQNYFRLYDKLAGMTGTALTEATEFKKIYELGVVQIPTNRPMVRDDRNDQVYKTKDGKWSAVVREIAARHEQRPADARRHDLRRGLRAARPSELTRARASSTRCSTPSPSTPSARARSSPRRGAPARSRSRPTWPAAASTSSSAATPSTSPSWSCARSSASSPATPTTRPRMADVLPELEEQRRGGARDGARGRRPLHLRHRAPRVAPHRQPASRPLRPPGRPRRVALLPQRRGRPRAPVRRRPHLPDPRPPRLDRRRGQRGADRGRDADASRSRRRRRRSRSRTS